MQSLSATPPPEVAETLDLGSLLGQLQAFEPQRWREFCLRYLKMTGRQADKIIQLWEELGAGYFDLARLTPVSPETYRAIAPGIRDGVLHAKPSS